MYDLFQIGDSEPTPLTQSEYLIGWDGTTYVLEGDNPDSTLWRHAKLTKNANGWTLHDLGGRDDVFVNQSRVVNAAPLVGSADVIVGPGKMRFTKWRPTAAEPPRVAPSHLPPTSPVALAPPISTPPVTAPVASPPPVSQPAPSMPPAQQPWPQHPPMGYGTMPPSGPPQHPSNPNYGYPGYPPAAAPQVPRWQPGAAVAIMFVAMVMPWIQSPVGMIQADGSYFTILKLLIAVGSNQRGGSGVIFIWSIPLISWFLALCGLGRFSWNRVALALGGIFGALFCLLILMGIMSSGNGQGLSVVGVGFFLYLGGAIFAVVASATKA